MSTTTQLYDRSAILSVFKRQVVQQADKKTLENIDSSGISFPSKESNGDPAFRIKFTIRKSNGPVLNTAVIEIYNLSAKSREFFKIYNLVILKAGYGKNLKNVFQGNINFAITRKVESSFITEIHAGDGGFGYQNAMVNQSFNLPTTANKAINSLSELFASTGITVGKINGVPDKTYNSGLVLSGKVVDRLKEICEANNLDWNIENGALNIVPYGGSLDNPIIVIHPDTGLIGIPEVRAQNLDMKITLLSFKTLLNPEIGVFQQISIVSKFVTGLFTATLVSHSGDTAGMEWYTECEAY